MDSIIRERLNQMGNENNLERLSRKIEWEYEFYYSRIVAESKASLVARAGEIDSKKEITKKLKELVRTEDAKTIRALLLVENLVDEVFRFFDQNPDRDISYAVNMIIGQYR